MCKFCQTVKERQILYRAIQLQISMTKSQFHLPSLQSPAFSEGPVSLYASTNACKQSQQEAARIGNRITYIRNEQLKLDKKIAENDEKALKIYESKKQNKEKMQQKTGEVKPISHQVEQQAKQRLQILLGQHKERIINIYTTINKQKVGRAQLIRAENMQDLREIRKQKFQTLVSLKQRARKIRSQEQVSDEMIQFKMEEKKLRLKAVMLNEFQSAILQKQNNEKKIRDLEQLELEYLKDLQNSQLQHKSAQLRYLEAKTLPANAFQEKYINSQASSSKHSQQGDGTLREEETAKDH